MSGELLPKDYAQWLSDLKAQINQAQQRATLSVNRELIKLYWQIGGSWAMTTIGDFGFTGFRKQPCN
jgi:hypothetical protein